MKIDELNLFELRENEIKVELDVNDWGKVIPVLVVID